MLTFDPAGRWVPPKTLLDCYNHMWIDTDVWELPDNVIYELYAQPTRGPAERGSYLVVLPPGYNDADINGERYPVLYWLHGGFSCSRHALWSLQFYARKMELGKMPKVILVAPQVCFTTFDPIPKAQQRLKTCFVLQYHGALLIAVTELA